MQPYDREVAILRPSPARRATNDDSRRQWLARRRRLSISANEREFGSIGDGR